MEAIEVDGKDMTATVGDWASWSISRAIPKGNQSLNPIRFLHNVYSFTLSRRHWYHVTLTFLRNQLCKLVHINTISNIFKLGTRGSILAILLYISLLVNQHPLLTRTCTLIAAKDSEREKSLTWIYMKHFSLPLVANSNTIHTPGWSTTAMSLASQMSGESEDQMVETASSLPTINCSMASMVGVK